MVTHKFFETADEVDEFLNSNYIEVIAITAKTSYDSFVTYTVFYNQ